jgi:hypothetical protein
MDEPSAASGSETPINLEINANHRYKAGQMGVLEFRVRNQGSGIIERLSLLIDCPCEKSRKKSSILKILPPSSEKKTSFQFEPARGGEALLEIELCLQDASQLPTVYNGHASVDIASIDEAPKPSTSFNLDIHDIGKFMGNDLSGMLSLAGKELNEDRLRERMERREPFWMRVDLDLDEQETSSRRDAAKKILCIPGDVPPPQSRRALLESLEPSFPFRAFVYSSLEVRFGRHTQRNDAVLRFLPDFLNDERSKTISGEQFVTRYSGGQCLMALAQGGHATTLVNGRAIAPGEQIPISNGAEIKIGSNDFGLQVHASPPSEDPQWRRTFEKILSFAPGEDDFRASRWDYISFSRPTNGQEEQYLWLLRKIELGWDTEQALEFRLGQATRPRARLSYGNGRYFLEILDSGSEIKVGDRKLLTGDVVCLGSETEILFGSRFRFRWSLL